MDRDNPENNPITIKPKTASHVAEQFSWVPLYWWSPPECSSPIKFLALSARVSPLTIDFRVLDRIPLSGPGRGLPSCNTFSFQSPSQVIPSPGHYTDHTVHCIPFPKLAEPHLNYQGSLCLVLGFLGMLSPHRKHKSFKGESLR